MSHVVIPPELLKGGGTFSSIFVAPPPESLRRGTILKGGGQSPPWKNSVGGTRPLPAPPVYALVYIHLYLLLLQKHSWD